MKQSEIAALLPGTIARGLRPEDANDPLAALLAVMEAFLEPCERTMERIDADFDPMRTRDSFVPYLAGWLDLDRLFDPAYSDGRGRREPISTGLGSLRTLVSSAAFLSQWRGTEKGLLAFLEGATGLRGFDVEEREERDGDSLPPFHIRVHAPKEAQAHAELLHRIIRSEKPAYVTYDLVFGPARPGGRQ